MKIKAIDHLNYKLDQCDIKTENSNFYIMTGNSTILVHNSPAIFFGLDPRPMYDNTFFIALKAAFAKDPKIMHTIQEIDQYYGDKQDLADKLKVALTELNKAYTASGDNKLFQGDLLFATKGDKRIENIDNQKYLTFKPNTIKYAIPVDNQSPNYMLAYNSKLGIFIHDSFNAKAIGNGIQVTPAGKKISHLVEAGKQTNVFIGSSTYDKVDINLSNKDKLQINHWISEAANHMNQVSNQFDDYYLNSKFMPLVKMFLNDEVKKDPPNIYTRAISENLEFDEEMFTSAFKKFLKSRYDKEIIGKGDKGIINAKQRFEEFEDLVTNLDFQNLIICTFFMIKIKGIFIKLFNQVESKLGKSFIEQPDGTWRSSPGEGFVLFIGDNQVKLVDRMDFSKANLTTGKFQK
jgi:hypothetical protein